MHYVEAMHPDRDQRLTQRIAATVRAEAARVGLNYTEIAPHLRMLPGQVGRKMRGHVPFTIDELGVLAVVFELEGASEFFRAAEGARLHAVA